MNNKLRPAGKGGQVGLGKHDNVWQGGWVKAHIFGLT